ncbi:MAG: hypothetical protein IJ735_01780 [Clostridia bacterium]|nr:hypothetical protein [Clostridia bacterium]
MKKFGKVLLTIFKVVVLLWILFLLVYLTIAIFNPNIDNKFSTAKGNYGKNPTWLADSFSTEADDIYMLRNELGEAEVTYRLYELACKKMMLSKAYGVRAVSDIGAKALDYTIQVASNRTEQYYNPGTPSLNANQKIESSYTNTIYVIDVNDDFLATILKSAIMFADRGYSDGEKSYKQKGSLEIMEDENEKITWSTKYEEVDTSKDRKYEDGDIRDKCNFIVNRTTIIPESAKITREYDEKLATYNYTVSFDLDCSGEGKDNAAYYEVTALKDVLGNNLKSIVYNTLHIDFRMSSNGYMTSWDSKQQWSIEYDAWLFHLAGEATIEKEEMLSYDPDECGVVDFTK